MEMLMYKQPIQYDEDCCGLVNNSSMLLAADVFLYALSSGSKGQSFVEFLWRFYTPTIYT